MSLWSRIQALFSRPRMAAEEQHDAAEIAVVNLSTRISADDVAKMAALIEAADRENFSPTWGCGPTPPKVYARIEDVPPGTPLLVLVPKSDVEGAAGYHTEDARGRISGVVAVDALLDAGWSLFTGAKSILACWSHEHFEAKKNPFVGMWSDTPDGDEDAFEMCDRVQGDAYEKTVDGVTGSISNFLKPHGFDRSPPEGATFDFMGVLTEPFEVHTATGGYATRRHAGGIFTIGERPAEKAHPWSRTAQRQASAAKVHSDLAEKLYAAYLSQSGGMNYQGKPCPSWTELPEAIRINWRTVATVATAEFRLGKPLLVEVTNRAGVE